MGMRSSAISDTIEAVNNNSGHAHASGNNVADGIEIWEDPALNPWNLYAAAKNFIDGLIYSGKDLDTVTDGMKEWIADKIVEKINKGEYELKPNGNYAGGLWYDDYGLATSFHAHNPGSSGYVKNASDWIDIIANTGTNGWAVGVTLGLADWEVNPTTGEVIWTGGTEYNFDQIGDWANRFFDSGDPREISKFAPEVTIDINSINPGIEWHAWLLFGSTVVLNITSEPRTVGGDVLSYTWNLGPIMFDGVEDGQTVSATTAGPDGSAIGTVTNSGGSLTYDLTAYFNSQVIHTTETKQYTASGSISGLSSTNSVPAYTNVEVSDINP